MWEGESGGELSGQELNSRLYGNAVFWTEWYTLGFIYDLSDYCVDSELQEDEARNRETSWDTFTML